MMQSSQNGNASSETFPVSNGAKKSEWFSLAVVFATVYFFSMNGLGALPNLAVNFLLKEKAALSPANLAYFQAVTMIAWVVKPLWGIISDLFPIFGCRRKSYLILTSLVAAAVWFTLSWASVPAVLLLLLLLTVADMAYAFQDVATDGLMVETGQSLNLTGEFQSIQWTAVYIAMILTSIAGGIFAELAQKGDLSYRMIFGITGIFPLLTVLVVIFLAREPKRVHLEREAGLGLRQALRHRGIWILALFLFLWNFSPSFGAPFFFYLVDTLRFSASFLGILQAVTSAGALVGSLLYGLVFAKLELRSFLRIAVWVGVFATLSYFIYFFPWLTAHGTALRTLALVMNFFLGGASAVIFLTLLNLAALTSPRYAGGTVFALLMSFYNLGQMGSSAFGGFLFTKIGLEPLIVVSAVFSLGVLFLIPHLPAPEMRRDGPLQAGEG